MNKSCSDPLALRERPLYSPILHDFKAKMLPIFTLPYTFKQRSPQTVTGTEEPLSSAIVKTSRSLFSPDFNLIVLKLLMSITTPITSIDAFD